MRKLLFLLAGCSFLFSCQSAGGQDDEYLDVVTRRAEKILAKLELENPDKEVLVRDIIAMQYYKLNGIHDSRDLKITEIREDESLDEASKQAKEEEIRAGADKEIRGLHDSYLEKLSGELTPAQVDMVKDGMTYGLVEHTYNAYLSLLPELTEEQKTKILDWLVEAREIAMDGGSSDEKHFWFRKYKGKINNYLSAEGYDLKAAEQKRK
jgi:hypothetical protein